MSTVKKESRFPTEVVDLPSKGLVYPEGHPLSQGKVEIKYMTAKEEDILTAVSLIQDGSVIDELLKSVVVTKVDFNDIIIGDKNAIMLATRVLGYGKEYKAEVICKECGAKEDTDFDLTVYKYKDIDESKYSKGNRFEFELPNAKRKIEFKLLTQGDETKIIKEIQRQRDAGIKAVGEITTRLRHQLISVDGDESTETITNFINNEFFAVDSRAFREYYASISPDVDFKTYFGCAACSATQDVELPISTNFFWPSR
tara:strand:- start:237 stop:1004 length:768 start_codon:yes stop_codon:yes gene_type:complete